MHEVLGRIRTIKSRSTDDPWIDEATKKVIQRRKDVFYEEQRGPVWKKLKGQTDDCQQKAEVL